MSSSKAGAVALPCQIGWRTAQREADILGLKRSSYSGETITLRQNKSRRGVQLGREMVVFVPEALRAVLDVQLPPPSEFIPLNEEGQRWTLDNFRHRFARVRKERGLRCDLHFHGLRHTHATRLAQAGATDSQIMAVTGHRTRSMVSVYTQEADQAMQAKQANALLCPPKKKPVTHDG
jgi:integrase